MATVPLTLVPSDDIKHFRAKWEGFAASGDDGTPLRIAGAYLDRTVQVMGTFTGSLGITWQGSLDNGVTWFTLTDLNATSIVLTAAGGKGVAEAVPLIRPLATAGAGGADVDCWIFCGGFQ